MTDLSGMDPIEEYWGRDDLGRRILEALAAANIDLDALTVEKLAPLDQYHSGGRWSTLRLARTAGLKAGMRVLDVGGGVGGPARTLAVEFGCHVTVVDLTESYLQAGEMLTARMGLSGRVLHQAGDALALPFEAAVFDAVWTQNSGMNIVDKERLYAGFRRVLRPGGLLVTQEPMAGPVQPPVFPLMWAHDAAMNFLRTPEAMRTVLGEAGFRIREWTDVTQQTAGPPPGSGPAYSLAQIVMGDALPGINAAGIRNRLEQRVVSIQAVCERA